MQVETSVVGTASLAVNHSSYYSLICGVSERSFTVNIRAYETTLSRWYYCYTTQRVLTVLN